MVRVYVVLFWFLTCSAIYSDAWCSRMWPVSQASDWPRSRPRPLSCLRSRSHRREHRLLSIIWYLCRVWQLSFFMSVREEWSFRKVNTLYVPHDLPTIMSCKAKRQYMLTLQIGRYCLLTLQSTIHVIADWICDTSPHITVFSIQPCTWLFKWTLSCSQANLRGHYSPGRLLLNADYNTALQSQMAVTAYFLSKQLPSFGLAEQSTRPVSAYCYIEVKDEFW